MNRETRHKRGRLWAWIYATIFNVDSTTDEVSASGNDPAHPARETAVDTNSSAVER
ncbi:hypothetical protein [Haladaptatus sp. ZSTT2]|uniref:hypothetical protein n=1 Tax=Haladaptatus sp. ZSTT2 TaxID=3120515 RepID=UPI00300E8201